MINSDPAFQDKVRRALTFFHDVSYLRTCPLANLLPLVNDRGQALQRLLCEAVEHLKPSGSPCASDRQWRLYLVLHYRYIEGQSRHEVMDRLAISNTTFKRVLRKALAAVCDYIKMKENDARLPPLNPEALPIVENFVGREAELANYCQQLERDHFVAIVGLAGAGKTALGAKLAASWQAPSSPTDHPARQVIWVTFREGRNTNMESLLEAMALSLAAMGQPAVWRFFQAERSRETTLLPESRVRYLLKVLEEGEYLLCLDDFYLVNEDKAINSLCADLLRSAERKKAWLLVMSRITPSFARGQLFQPLDGLCREDARRLLEMTGLPELSETLFAELYARTAGLPIFLKLFVAWACSQALEVADSAPAEEKLALFVKNMTKTQNVRAYLLHEMYEALSPQEQRFLACVAIFRTPFEIEESLIVAILTAEGVQDIETTWTTLADRHIFTYLETGMITLHPLLRDYLQRHLQMSPGDWVRIHQRVGEYYEQSEQSREAILEAGYHYFEAREHERATRLLSKNVTRLINAGQAEAALAQLEQLTPCLTQPGAELRFEAAVARETLCHLLGLREKQRAALRTLLALAEELGDDRRLALACNHQARFYEVLGEHIQAIAATEAGQVAARRAGDKAAEVESLNRRGVLLRRRSDYVAARECHEQALALAREVGDRRGEARGLDSLGDICHFLGDYDTAQSLCKQALVIWQAIGDRQGEASTMNALGAICWRLGDYPAAQGFYKQSLSISQAIGDLLGETAGLNNLGVVYCNLGNYTAAQTYFEQTLVIWQAIGNQFGAAISLNNLGMVHREQGNYAAAQARCQQSLAIERPMGDQDGIACTLIDLGMALEGLGDLDGAQAAYREAISIRHEIGQATLAIDDVAGLARVALARRQRDKERGRQGNKEAREYVEECLAYIAANGVAGIEYVFEVYLTCIDVLEVCGERERARGMLEEAYALLMERADKISDEILRRSYLENVPANRELARAWAAVRATTGCSPSKG